MRITSSSSPNATSDHCLFFDGSVPTPAPLAKRLRTSADSVEEVDTVSSPQSQPVEISSVKDDTESGNSDDDDCQLLASFSQPLPITSVNERRISSTIATNVPITPKPAFDQMKTPELRVIKSFLILDLFPATFFRPRWLHLLSRKLSLTTGFVVCRKRRPSNYSITSTMNYTHVRVRPFIITAFLHKSITLRNFMRFFFCRVANLSDVEAPSILDVDESKKDLKPAEDPLYDCAAGVDSDEIVITPKPIPGPSVNSSAITLSKFVLF